MPGIELIQTFLKQASARGSRSNALNPLAWAFGMTLSALIASILAGHSPSWLTILLAVFASLILLAYLGAYGFLMVKDRDALRSESFTLSKMAIERSVTGDNLQGFVKMD